MAKKFYAVRKGITTGIFRSWDECKNAVSGYSGAEYRGFSTEEEAKAYMCGEEVGTKQGQFVTIEEPKSEKAVNIYTDGSYKDRTVGIGVHIDGINGFSRDFYGVVDCPKFQNLRNIGGELFSVLVGVQCAVDMGFTDITILYDYDGVEKWFTSEWGANGELQQAYTRVMQGLSIGRGISFKFLHVAGHSGVKGNKRADQMAKRGTNMSLWIDSDKILSGKLTVNDVGVWCGV